MEPFLFASLAYFGWGIGDIFGVIATRKLGGYSTTVWSLLFRLVLFAAYLPFAISYLANLTWGLFFLILLIGSVGVIGFAAFNEGLRIGNAALIGTIAAAFPLVTVLLSVIFLKESLMLNQVLAIFVIIVGVVVSSLNWQQVKGRVKIDQSILFAVIAMIAWGTFFAFIKVPVEKLGWFLPNYIAYLTFPLVLLFMKYRKIGLTKPNYQGALLPLLAGVFLLGMAEFSYNLGITVESVSIIAPVAGSYPTLYVVLAFFIFKDRITRQQIAGIVMTLIGIVLLSVLSI